jgi:hypothetical protein
MTDPIRNLAHSRFAQARLAARPGLARELEDPQPFARAEMVHALSNAPDPERLKPALRNLR